jgi:hypothetical protein
MDLLKTIGLFLSFAIGTYLVGMVLIMCGFPPTLVKGVCIGFIVYLIFFHKSDDDNNE